AALLLPGCAEETADHAAIFNRGNLPAQLHVAFSSSDGDVVREETRTLAFGESFRFSLDHPRDGTYRLVVEAEDGRSAEMTLTWQGGTGPVRVRFEVYDDRIDEEQLVT
ncbi:MAG TPA: hypothetical protein VJ874_00395, partial [Candidatus Thermoplasmatota archaeon]|nr:hypothetical protein [Candidatus Thermoplasmatota archaeon]